MRLLDVSHLRKSYGDTVAVSDVSFSVSSGEVFGLLGPNGAGKTTTMSMIAGLLTPDSGTVILDGRTFEPNQYDMRKMLGVVPQDLAIYPELTAFENLRFFGELYELRGALLKQRIEAALDRTGLASHAGKLAATFSGGMKRRLNFGIALLHEPRLLILDEPTVGVDPQSRSHLLNCIRQLAEGGMATVYASHYMEEVEAVCDRVAIVDRGRMLASGPLEELLGQLRADLLLHVPHLPAEAVSRLQELDGVQVADARRSAGTESGELAAVRPEMVVTIQGGPGALPGGLNRQLTSVLQALEQAGVELKAIQTRESNLERLFLELTGQRLRD